MKKFAQIFKALGDETRLEIVMMLMGREMCVCDILDAFNLSQPAISHHLKILKQADILVDSRNGKWIYYSLNSEILAQLKLFMQDAAGKSVLKERWHTCDDIEPEEVQEGEDR